MAEARKTAAKKTAAAQQSAPPEKPGHDVTVADHPDSYVAQGGRVTASCTCGWEESGRYSRDRHAEAVRIGLESRGAAHVADPENESGS